MVNLINKIFNIFQTVHISIINVINILYDIACKNVYHVHHLLYDPACSKSWPSIYPILTTHSEWPFVSIRNTKFKFSQIHWKWFFHKSNFTKFSWGIIGTNSNTTKFTLRPPNTGIFKFLRLICSTKFRCLVWHQLRSEVISYTKNH